MNFNDFSRAVGTLNFLSHRIPPASLNWNVACQFRVLDALSFLRIWCRLVVEMGVSRAHINILILHPGIHISPTIFHYNSNSAENLFYYYSFVGQHITSKMCTCHDRTAVVPCAKFHRDYFTTTSMSSELNLQRIWIMMKILFVKWAPVSTSKHSSLPLT